MLLNYVNSFQITEIVLLFRQINLTKLILMSKLVLNENNLQQYLEKEFPRDNFHIPKYQLSRHKDSLVLGGEGMRYHVRLDFKCSPEIFEMRKKFLSQMFGYLWLAVQEKIYTVEKFLEEGPQDSHSIFSDFMIEIKKLEPKVYLDDQKDLVIETNFARFMLNNETSTDYPTIVAVSWTRFCKANLLEFV